MGVRRSCVCLWRALLLLMMMGVKGEAHDAAAHVWDRNENDYTRYPAYPPYCSTPDQMERRRIPPLQPLEIATETTRLVHVTTVLRHGARTPWSHEQPCWKGYWESPETGVWNCPSLHTTASLSMPLYLNTEKQYDALLPSSSRSNFLNGTCQLGQLLERGYAQEMANGKHLRDAYLYNANPNDPPPLTVDATASDIRMRLLDTTTSTNDPESLLSELLDQQVYFRSDDMQRTIASGQILLQGLLGPELEAIRTNRETNSSRPPYYSMVLHTADYQRDYLGGLSQAQCPRLTELQEEAMKSPEYQFLYHDSEDALQLNAFMKNELGQDFIYNAFDCLMTTMCNDRPLPPILNDYIPDNDPPPQQSQSERQHENVRRPLQEEEGHSYGDGSLFTRLAEMSENKMSFPSLFHDAAYAKLSMGPLWAEIMSKIHPILSVDTSDDMDQASATDSPTTPKLVLIAAHDWTLFSLLATLGPRVWGDTKYPPYASMINLEIHQILKEDRPDDEDNRELLFPSKFAFRLVYNGNVLTSRIDGCPSDDAQLCDVSVLLDRIDPIATWTPNCELVSSSLDAEQDQTPSTVHTNNLFQVWNLLFLGTALGAGVMFLYMSRRQQEEAHNLIRQLSMPTRFEPTPVPVVNERTSLFVDHTYGM